MMGSLYEVKRTQRDLIDSLSHLLKKMSFEKITIDDICEDAMVHRSTFYRYYHNKYELLQNALEYIVGLYFHENGEPTSDVQVIKYLIKIVASDAQLFRNITINNEFFDSYSQLVKIVSDIIVEGLLAPTSGPNNRDLSNFPMFNNIAKSKNVSLSVRIFSGALLTVFIEWLKTPDASEETLNEMIDDLICDFQVA
ncbi:TetR/AcrR family transcriptional regulator [Lentilactobacillus sp. SPB1-3]|uniref:TetR/AcrR family transcriptional regulator n=1 Tax=Lentilactobacillus terminaliae TaxID=3003483 RepID=A0ACD5DD26_9LACO|nr:TetR/AcrR family transcriptional regulator [Lentilactobacillus sp. SPB1-3]MCZ0977983.1 TetR/AcrR family transcriptional regulator [Lentilactobacillus sp. SPB1-3]